MRFTVRVMLLAALVTAGCGGYDSPSSPSSSANVSFSSTDLRVGTGAEAINGRLLTVNYTGWLYSATATDNKGTQFDSSIGRGPYPFQLGVRAVIAGWDQGVLGMRVGGLRRLVIPPSLGYGAQGNPPVIPPNSTLVFDIELLTVQ